MCKSACVLPLVLPLRSEYIIVNARSDWFWPGICAICRRDVQQVVEHLCHMQGMCATGSMRLCCVGRKGCVQQLVVQGLPAAPDQDSAGYTHGAAGADAAEQKYRKIAEQPHCFQNYGGYNQLT